MRPIKLGHIGTLHDHSSAKLECVRKFPELFEVIGVVPESPERWEEIKDLPAYSGVRCVTREELFEAGVEAVLVEGFERQLIIDALYFAERGVHLHIDKPAGDDVATFEKLLRVAKEKNLTVQMAYMYRYNAALLDCLSRIEKGELGEIYSVTAIMNTGHPASKREWLSRLPGGIFYFLGCHMIDLVYRLLGKPDEIHPFLKSTGFDGVESIDFGHAVFEYRNGVSTLEATSAEINGYGRRQLVVCGSRGTYEIEPLEAPTHAYFISADQAVTFGDRRVEVELPPFDGKCRYDEMMKDFAAFVRGERENPFTYSYELELQKLIAFCCFDREVDWRSTTEI